MVQECWEKKKQLLMGVVGEAQSLERLLVEAGVVVIPALAASELSVPFWAQLEDHSSSC